MCAAKSTKLDPIPERHLSLGFCTRYNLSQCLLVLFSVARVQNDVDDRVDHPEAPAEHVERDVPVGIPLGTGVWNKTQTMAPIRADFVRSHFLHVLPIVSIITGGSRQVTKARNMANTVMVILHSCLARLFSRARILNRISCE